MFYVLLTYSYERPTQKIMLHQILKNVLINEIFDIDGVIGIGIAATAVGLVAGGIAAAFSARKK